MCTLTKINALRVIHYSVCGDRWRLVQMMGVFLKKLFQLAEKYVWCLWIIYFHLHPFSCQINIFQWTVYYVLWGGGLCDFIFINTKSISPLLVTWKYRCSWHHNSGIVNILPTPTFYDNIFVFTSPFIHPAMFMSSEDSYMYLIEVIVNKT